MVVTTVGEEQGRRYFGAHYLKISPKRWKKSERKNTRTPTNDYSQVKELPRQQAEIRILIERR